MESVHQQIEALKIRLSPASRPIDPREGRIIEAYQRPGESLRGVASEFGCAIETVRKILLKHGIPRNPPHKNLHPHSGHTRGLVKAIRAGGGEK